MRISSRKNAPRVPNPMRMGMKKSFCPRVIMAENQAVTHCYERPTFPDWPYTHFTMVHATTPEGCEEIGREISQATGITDNQMLYSTREYKKTRVRYFVEDFQEFWETEAAEMAGPS